MKRRMILADNKPGENTVLLLHGDDFNDSMSNQLLTSSNVAINGAGKFGKCFYCGGFVSIPSAIVKNLHGKDFTVDFWVKMPATPANGTKILMLGLNSENWASGYGGIDINISGGSFGVILYNGTPIYIEYISPFAVNEWIHVAVVVMNKVFYMYINGVLKATKAYSGDLTPMNNTYSSRLGNGVSGYFPFTDKYIDEFRISNVARWTSNFTPPTKPY